MLTWFAAALAGLAVAVAVVWTRRRVDELGRPRRFPWVSVGLLPAMAGCAAVPEVARAAQERRLGAGRGAGGGALPEPGRTFVDAGPELGHVRWRADGSPEPWALIKRDQCRHLAAHVRSGKQRPSRDQVVAVHVLTHEAMRLSGRLAEAAAECAAVQRDAHTAGRSAPTRPRPPATGATSTR